MFRSRAFLETIGCTATAVLLTYFTHSIVFMAAWTLIGWCFLLRTPSSILAAIRVFNLAYRPYSRLIRRVYDRTHDVTLSLNPWTWVVWGASALWRATLLVSASVFIAIWALASRAAATVYGLGRHPLHTMASLPRNWRRVSLSDRLLANIEFVPRHALWLRLSQQPGIEVGDVSWIKLRRLLLGDGVDNLVGWAVGLLAIGILVGGLWWALPRTEIAHPAFEQFRIDANRWKQIRDHTASFRIAEEKAASSERTIEPVVFPPRSWALRTSLDSSSIDRWQAQMRELVLDDAWRDATGCTTLTPTIEPKNSDSSLRYRPLDIQWGMPFDAMRDSDENSSRARLAYDQTPTEEHMRPGPHTYLVGLLEFRWNAVRDIRDSAERSHSELAIYLSRTFGGLPSVLVSLDHLFYRLEHYAFADDTRDGVPGMLLAACFLCVIGITIGLACSLVVASINTPLRLMLFMPVLCARVSLKATAIAYGPLYWVLEVPWLRLKDPTAHFDWTVNDTLAVVARQFSKLFFLLLVGWVVAVIASRSAPLIGRFTPSWLQIFPWHVASAAAATCTFVAWFLSHRMLRRKSSSPATQLLAHRVVVTAQRLAALLAVYTTTCGVYSAYTILLKVRFPPFEWVFFPWGR